VVFHVSLLLFIALFVLVGSSLLLFVSRPREARREARRGEVNEVFSHLSPLTSPL